MGPASTASPASRVLTRTGLLTLAVLAAACGGSGEPRGTAPTISNLKYFPHGAFIESLSGPAGFNGTIDFSDPDGDLASWTLSVFDGGGQRLSSNTGAIVGASGMKAGTLAASGTLDISVLGSYSFQIQLTDAQGLRSNTLGATFRITHYPWSSIPLPPGWRDTFATAFVDGRIYVIGGDEPGATQIPPPPTDRVDVLDPSTLTWTSGPTLSVPLRNAFATTIGGKVIVLGEAPVALEAWVRKLDPESGRWTDVPPPPAWHTQGSAAVAGGRVYVVGGRELGAALTAVSSLDPSTGIWRAETPLPVPRLRPAAVTLELPGSGPRVFVVGGYAGAGVTETSFAPDSQSLDPVGSIWSTRAGMGPCEGAAAVAFDGKLVAFGGESLTEFRLSAVRWYDPTLDTWLDGTPLPVPGRWLRAEVVGRRIFVFGPEAIQIYSADDEIL